MPRNLVLSLTLLALLATDAVSQSSSGRHRVQRVAPAAEAEQEGAAGPSRWFLTLGAGMATSGDVVRIRSAGNSGVGWAPPGGRSFVSPDVRLTLDEGPLAVVGVGRRLTPRWWARVDIGASSIDLAAEARRGELVESLLWDRFNLLTVSMGLEYRLVDLPSFPYLVGGVGAVRVGGDGDDQFDQTRSAWRLGAGYHQHLSDDWAVRLEVRDTVTDLDLEDYVPPVAGDQVPDYELEELGPLQVFELALVMTGRF